MAEHPILLILAGGASSRMWPLTEKSLLHFGADPLLTMQLKAYAALGFQEAIVIANPQNLSAIQGLLDNLTELKTQIAVQTEPLGMGDAILQAAPLLTDRPNAALYINQVHDVVDSLLHEAMLEAYQADPSRSYLAGYEREDYFPGGYLIVDEDGRISGIIEKPGAENRPSNLVNIVAHIHANVANLMSAIRTEYAKGISTDDHYERAMTALMPDYPYQIVPYRGAWWALKYPWHTLDIMDFYLSKLEGQHIAEDVFIADTARISGAVLIEKGVKIFPGAAVVGPVYIGAGTIIGNNALVRNSMVLSRCEVGFTTEIARSYVADHCAMHACRVLDSILAPNVNFSAGCTTANLRIDRGHVYSRVKGELIDTGRDKLGAMIGAGAFISVDAMTMPGVKIGANAEIGPTTNVRQDVQDNYRVYVRQELVIEDRNQPKQRHV